MERKHLFEHQPLYEQVKRALLAKIASGEWAPGQKVPSESEIAQEYKVSSGTLRKVMEFLEDKKFILRHQGRGTYVLSASSRELMQRFERFRADDYGSLLMTLEVLSHMEGEPTEAENDNLKLRKGQLVRRIARVRSSRGSPFLYEQIALPAEMFPADKDIDNPEFWIETTARNSGVLLGDAQEALSLESCPSVPASRLGVRNGTTVMRIQGVMDTIEGKPARWRDAYFHGKGIHYAVSLTRSG